MTDLDILGVLNYQLSQYLAINPIDVNYPNIKYVPVIGTPYLKVDLLPATTSQASIGSDSRGRHIGIYQIMIISPKEKSFAIVKPAIDGLKEFFKFGSKVIHLGLEVRITRFQVESYIEDDAWFFQPISISYRTDLEN